MASATMAPPAEGVILAGAVYTLAEVNRRLKLGKHALRTARRKGLKPRRIGRNVYYLGSDLIAYVESAASY